MVAKERLKRIKSFIIICIFDFELFIGRSKLIIIVHFGQHFSNSYYLQIDGLSFTLNGEAENGFFLSGMWR